MEPKDKPRCMLFMACLLEGTNTLDFEKEEGIFRIIGKYNIDMQIENTGSLAGLKEVNNKAGGFDIIHITGHAGT
ncbi:MAG: hypothetical protein HQL06_03515 [Nitrospirae bacterium]|nr:hypothetical protein [Nitrospirota bacterium]